MQLSLIVAVASLAASAPASAQGVGEGRMRILGRATVEAVPGSSERTGAHARPDRGDYRP
jgi:hypothetical protein